MKKNISIIIPCRNEEKFIAKCLDSVLEQDYPKEMIEVLVVDGMSEDKTREIIKEYSEKYPFIKLIDNPDKFTPFTLNRGIENSKGEIIFIIGAHAKYQNDYISKCVKYLEEYQADNVGGVMKTVPRNNSLKAKAIALCLSSMFGAGNSTFRTGSDKPTWVDTVFGGCYRREVFDKIGMFNEKLIRSQDMEFNIRLKKSGGKILLVPDIVSYYYPKDRLMDFFKHNIKDGIWAIYPLKFVKLPMKLRHYIPLLFVLSFIILLPLSFIHIYFHIILSLLALSYLFMSLYFSFKIALGQKDIRYLFVMPSVFAIRHFGYGFGSIWGLIKLI